MRSIRPYLLGAAMFVGVTISSAQPTNWNTTSGLWSNAANWSNGVPVAAGTTAVIDQTGANVTLDASQALAPSIDSLQLTTGTLNITNNTLTLAPPSTAVSPLAMGANTVLNVSDGGGTGQLVFQMGGSNNTYNATALSSSQIDLTSTGGAASMVLNSAPGGGNNTLSLTGGGTLTLSGGAAITGDGTTSLTTDFNIHGDGGIVGIGMTSNGNIDTSVVNGQGLLIAPSAAGFVNNGTITATAAVIGLGGFLGGSFTNSGTILTQGSGIQVISQPNNTGNAPILTNTGVIGVNSGDYLAISAIDAGPVTIQNNGAIGLSGSDIDQLPTTLAFVGDNTADPNVFYLNSSGTNTAMIQSGIGTSDSAYNQILGGNGNETVVNGVGHGIAGTGTMWSMNLVNNGVIETNPVLTGIQNTLNVMGNNPDLIPTHIGFTNNGLLRAGNFAQTADPGLVIDTTFGGFQNNAVDPGNGNAGVQVGVGSNLQFASAGFGGIIDNNGTINNNGTLSFNSYGGTFYLSGSGTLQLNSSQTVGTTGTELVVNGSGHTIAGNGATIGVALINNGLISAGANGITMVNVPLTNNGTANGPLAFDSGPLSTLINNGTVNSPQLSFGSTGSLTITNNGTINLIGGLNFAGGSVSLNGSGSLNLFAANITQTGSVNLTIGAGQQVTGSGSIQVTSLTNNGSITAAGGNLTIQNLTNYSGGVLSGGSYATQGTALIIQNLGPIQTIGVNTSVSISGGSSMISSDGSTDALTALTVNSGTLALAGGYSLTLDHSAATFTNNGSLIVGAGSTMDATSRQFTNIDANGALTGTYNIGGVFHYAPQNGSNGQIVTIAPGASLTLNGAGLMTMDGTTNAISQLSQNQGSLTLTNLPAPVVLTSSTYSNSGTLTLDGATLDTRNATFSDFNSKQLFGGTYNIGTGSTFFFTPSGGGNGDILSIGTGVSVTLTDDGRIAYGAGNGTDALLHLELNNGTLSINGTRNLTINSATGSFDNYGTLQVGAGAVFSTGTSTFNEVSASGDLMLGNYAIGGTFHYTPGAGAGGITTIDPGVSVALSGSGAITYGAGNTNAFAGLAGNYGNLSLNGVSNFSVSGGFTNYGTLSVTGSTFSAGGPLVNTFGTVTLSGNSTLTAPGYQSSLFGSLTVNTGATADFRGGNFTSVDPTGLLQQGNFVVGGALRYDNGNTVGITVINSDASLTISGSGSILYGPGAGTDALSSTLAENDGTFSLTNGAVLNLTQAQFFNINTLTLSGTGTILTTGNFSNSGDFINYGSTVMNQGAAFWVGDTTFNVGSIALDGANTKLASGGITMGTTASLTLTNGATADLRAAFNPIFGAGTDTFTNLANGVLSGGIYYINGNLLFDPSSDAAGGNILLIDSSTQLTLAGAYNVLYGGGTGSNALAQLAENDGSLAVIQDATLHTTTDFANTGEMLVATGGLFQTDGTFTNTGATDIAETASVLTGTGYVQQSGVTQVDGALTSDVTVSGGMLEGTGTVYGDVTVQSGGTVKPGDSPGTLTVNGNYTQQAGGTLQVDFVNLSDFGVLDVAGTADLNGFIDIDLLNSFTFQFGDTFAIVFGNNVIDDGIGISDRYAGNGLMFVPVFQAGELDIEVENTPEPGTVVLLGGGLLLAAALWRRRRPMAG